MRAPAVFVFALGVVLVSVGASGQVFVSTLGDNSTGNSWAAAFTDVATGVARAAVLGEDVWIAEGVYTVTSPVSVSSNIALFGGFPSTGNPVFADRNPGAFPTELDGLGTAPTLLLCDNVTGVLISGLTLTRASGSRGGALNCVNLSDVSVEECVFSENTAGQFGAGVFVEDSNVSIRDCDFVGNVANEGAALMLFRGSADVHGCSFVNNDGGGQGGAILAFDSPVALDRCVFDGNVGARGGAVAVREGLSATITNGLFVGNAASNHGAGINFEFQSGIRVANCTFVGNTADTRGGGVFFHDSQGLVVNCIFEDNNNHAIYENSVSTDPFVDNCLFFDNPDGVYFDESTTSIATAEGRTGLNAVVLEADGNLDADPVFVDRVGMDYHIRPFSPAIDTGAQAGAPLDDIDGEIRPVNVLGSAARAPASSFDIGHDEFLDTDGDTMPDYWEIRFGLDPNDAVGPNGANGDPDADGVSNATEFASNTDPTARASVSTASFGSGSCFIATAAYGTPLADDIGVLRAFRDRRLLSNGLGTALADAYYRLSPALADVIARRPGLARAIRVPLYILVDILTSGHVLRLLMTAAVTFVGCAAFCTRKRMRAPRRQ